MLVGITRMFERQSEHSGKSHEEDLAERFRKQGPKEFAWLNLNRTVRPSITCLGNLDGKPMKISWMEFPRRDGRNKFRRATAASEADSNGGGDGEGRRESGGVC
ncbi:hypothetical protein F511_41896 [Dorcoceras hygrometricum]|uniref:Uncharacterized protein n=1 Tax=Dorcoceras hygrometricum TaxID=472368 RepID=A0A2Z7AKA4_9LAMI|nr:hypothetical protein F511_41896 [Dorcoceras hygrometricum]